MTQGRGGKRQGRTGTAYGNRTDLNTGQVRSNPVYGDQAATQRNLQAVPAGPSPASQVPQGATQAPPGGNGVPPGALPDLHAATDRPDEPVTTGAALGPGAGPTVVAPEQEALKKWRPHLQAMIQMDPPPSVLNALRWLNSQIPPD